MAQFDVYRLETGEIVLDIQTDLLGYFDSRIVVPLMSAELAPIAHPRLNPTFEIGDDRYIMVTQFATAIRTSSLLRSIADLTQRYDAIRSALDMIFLGF